MLAQFRGKCLSHGLPHRFISPRFPILSGLSGFDGIVKQRRHRVVVKALVDKWIRCRMAVLGCDGLEFLDSGAAKRHGGCAQVNFRVADILRAGEGQQDGAAAIGQFLRHEMIAPLRQSRRRRLALELPARLREPLARKQAELIRVRGH